MCNYEALKIDKGLSQKLADCSFVASVLVVWQHVGANVSGGGQGLYWWIRAWFCDGVTHLAVPFFFVVSGFLLAGRMHERGWWFRAVRSRVVSLGVPYLIWDALVTIFIFGLLWLAVGSGHDALYARMLSAAPGGAERWTHMPGWHELWVNADYPLWYLRTLLLAVVVLSPLFSLYRYDRHGVLPLLVLLVMAGVKIWLCPDCASVDKFLTTTFDYRCLVFFGAGVWLRYHPIAVSRKVGWFCLVVYFALLTGKVMLPEGTAAARYWADFIGLIAFWVLFPKSSLPRWLTSCSFPIYILHGPLLYVVSVFFVRECDVLIYAVTAIFAVVACIGITLGVRQCPPVVSKVLFGGR